MTEREVPDDRDYPDGSVGRYVRERWGAIPAATRPYVAPLGPRPVPDRPHDDDPVPPAVPLPSAAPAPAPDDRHQPPGGPDRAPSRPGSSAAGRRSGSVLPFRAAASAPAPAAPDVRGRPPAPAAPERSAPDRPAAVRPFLGVPAPLAPVPDAPASPDPAPDSSAPAPPVPERGGTDRPDTGTAPDGRAAESDGPESTSGGPLPGAGHPDRCRTAAPRGSARWTDPGAMAAQEAQRARSTTDLLSPDLTSARLLRPSRRPPQSGWRRLLYVMSGRLINPGESPADVRRRELTARANRPLLGCYKIAMLSLKGGVGKTTMTATLGATFASLRGDRVVAVDANPDRGTLSQKIPLETTATVRHLLRDAQRVRRYTDVRAYTSQGPSRLEVLASEQDPAVSEAFSEDDYRRTVNLLEHFYNIVLTDCGTGLMHSAMNGVLGVADQLIIVSSGSIDGARSASATLDWLNEHGHGELVRSSVVVINCVHCSAGGVDLDLVAAHFAARCRSVVRIPFDAHLEEGAEVELDRLEPTTRTALLELAAAVADVFEGTPV